MLRLWKQLIGHSIYVALCGLQPIKARLSAMLDLSLISVLNLSNWYIDNYELVIITPGLLGDSGRTGGTILRV